MNEGPDNPFQSPVSIPESRTIPGRTRRIAGIVAYLGAGYGAFVGVTKISMLAYAMLYPQFAGNGENGPRISIISLGLAALLGWAGYRLRHRPRGVIEWLIVALFSLLVINAALVAIILVLFSD